jgi:IclR family acetate operon transcriptional repressor
MEKIFALLEYLAAEGRAVSLQSITEASGISKPTAYRLLQSLLELGYVARPAAGREYLIGPRAARLATIDPYAHLKSATRPILRRLHEALNETVNLGVLSDTQVTYLDYLETTQALRFIVIPGEKDSFYNTALGRAIAAQLDESQLERLLQKTRLELPTSHAVRNLPDLRKLLEATRNAGIAEEFEESTPGVCCLATSLARLGFPEAAISVAVPVQRLNPERKIEIIKALETFTHP